MKHLYAPWRGIYAQENGKLKRHTEQSGSPFSAEFAADNDEENFILKRLKHHGIMLNHYPYNPGHLLIIPYRVAPALSDLTREERIELMEATNASVSILKTYLQNDGANVGLNLGDASSGGSIPDHLHVHIVPRWHGDTGFLATTAQTKVLSEDLRVVYNTLKKPFAELDIYD